MDHDLLAHVVAGLSPTDRLDSSADVKRNTISRTCHLEIFYLGRHTICKHGSIGSLYTRHLSTSGEYRHDNVSWAGCPPEARHLYCQ